MLYNLKINVNNRFSSQIFDIILSFQIDSESFFPKLNTWNKILGVKRGFIGINGIYFYGALLK